MKTCHAKPSIASLMRLSFSSAFRLSSLFSAMPEKPWVSAKILCHALWILKHCR